jgi:hypothetical protein
MILMFNFVYQFLHKISLDFYYTKFTPANANKKPGIELLLLSSRFNRSI